MTRLATRAIRAIMTAPPSRSALSGERKGRDTLFDGLCVATLESLFKFIVGLDHAADLHPRAAPGELFKPVLAARDSIAAAGSHERAEQT